MSGELDRGEGSKNEWRQYKVKIESQSDRQIDRQIDRYCRQMDEMDEMDGCMCDRWDGCMGGTGWDV